MTAKYGGASAGLSLKTRPHGSAAPLACSAATSRIVLFETRGIDAGELRELRGRVRRHDRACFDGIAVVIELEHQSMQAFVVDVPGDMTRLRDDVDRLLGIAERLVREAFAPHIHLITTLDDQRPEDRMPRPAAGRRALIGVDVAHSGARASPQRIASPLLPGCPKNVAPTISGMYCATISALPAKPQQARISIAAEILDAAVGTLHAHATRAIRIRERAS